MPENTPCIQEKPNAKAIGEFLLTLTDERISNVSIWGNSVQVTYKVTP